MSLNFITFDTHPKLSTYLADEAQISDDVKLSHVFYTCEPDNQKLLELAAYLSTKEGSKDLLHGIEKGFGSRPFVVSKSRVTDQIQKLSSDIREFVDLGGFYYLSIGKARFPISYRIDSRHYFRISFIYDPDVEDPDVSITACLTSLERDSPTLRQALNRLEAA